MIPDIRLPLIIIELSNIELSNYRIIELSNYRIFIYNLIMYFNIKQDIIK